MNPEDGPEEFLVRADERVRAARAALGRRRTPDVVRFSQEAVELSLKSALRSAGIDYPKFHDVGFVLEDHRDKFPAWFRSAIPEMAELSHALADRREAALYGSQKGVGPTRDVRDPRRAREFLQRATVVLGTVRKLVQGSTSARSE
ncbi:MAG: HEPN domain-containing protein [Euryarchaeota archaeon]|nr:HEPN domain-containing protein [Euryarchaeota archaeon]MDE1836076.1 HEPN domain-containing protein [Euryarchaeota archaeon]MDE1879976.1 HEPN domain-containing protein [Euryarchaeota archaeon]MDE2044054.1 HEPN domain-containing protein [Thermoplasmata archaeon]